MTAIEKAWYSGAKWVWWLWPLSGFFALISAARRGLFRLGIKSSHQVKVPVIVVGNISVGGNGKTPVVVALVEYFQRQGKNVGVLSRGYGGSAKAFPRLVLATDSAAIVGDEPSLIARRTQAKVVIDPLRARGAEYLVTEAGCDIIICDDGLQHYALGRTVELVVMDNRLVGNGHLLPMGPLREGLWRLNTVDGIVLNQTTQGPDNVSAPTFNMALSATEMVNVRDKSLRLSVADFVAKFGSANALSGIGNPARFYRQLEGYGLIVHSEMTFPDHHQFSPDDIPSDTVVMTEKDAVKVAAFAHEDCWYLPIEAQLPERFYQTIEQKLQNN